MLNAGGFDLDDGNDMRGRNSGAENGSVSTTGGAGDATAEEVPDEAAAEEEEEDYVPVLVDLDETLLEAEEEDRRDGREQRLLRGEEGRAEDDDGGEFLAGTGILILPPGDDDHQEPPSSSPSEEEEEGAVAAGNSNANYLPNDDETDLNLSFFPGTDCSLPSDIGSVLGDDDDDEGTLNEGPAAEEQDAEPGGEFVGRGSGVVDQGEQRYEGPSGGIYAIMDAVRKYLLRGDRKRASSAAVLVSVLAAAALAAISIGGNLYLLRQRLRLDAAARDLRREVEALRLELEAATAWDSTAFRSRSSSTRASAPLLDNCWVRAKADVELGECGRDAKDRAYREAKRWEGSLRAAKERAFEAAHGFAGQAATAFDGTASTARAVKVRVLADAEREWEEASRTWKLFEGKLNQYTDATVTAIDQAISLVEGKVKQYADAAVTAIDEALVSRIDTATTPAGAERDNEEGTTASSSNDNNGNASATTASAGIPVNKVVKRAAGVLLSGIAVASVATLLSMADRDGGSDDERSAKNLIDWAFGAARQNHRQQGRQPTAA